MKNIFTNIYKYLSNSSKACIHDAETKKDNNDYSYVIKC